MRLRRFTLDEEPLEEPIVNLTPLIDVVFVVLISFILIAPILEIDNINLAVGSTELKKNALETSSLSIVVKKDNTIWVRGEPVSLSQFEETLRSYKITHPKNTPQMICDRDAAFGTYQSIKNALERCGFDQMDLILQHET